MPADRDQAEEPGNAPFGGLPVEDRDRILGGVGAVQPLAVRRERQCGRHRPVQLGRRPLRPYRLDHPPGGDVDQRQRVRSGVGADDNRSARGDGQPRGMEPDRDLVDRAGFEVDPADGALRGDVPDRVDADARPLPRRTGEVAGAGAAPAEVRDQRPAADEDDVERGHADVERAEHGAGGGLEFEEPVGEVAADVQPRAVGRQGEAARHLRGALGSAGGGQRQGPEGGQSPIGDREHLHRSLHVAHEQPRAVRREHQACQARQRLLVGGEVPLGRPVGGAGGRRRDRRDSLPHRTAVGIDDDHLRCLPRRDEQPAVGRQGDGLRAQAGERHERAQRREHLVDRRDQGIVGLPADGRFGRFGGLRACRLGRQCRQDRHRRQTAEPLPHRSSSLGVTVAPTMPPVRETAACGPTSPRPRTPDAPATRSPCRRRGAGRGPSPRTAPPRAASGC